MMFINFKKLMLLASASFIFFSNSIHAKTLSLNEKIGQLLIVSCPSNDTLTECKHLIHDLHVGGFIYYSWINPLQAKDELKKLTQELQKQALSTRHQIPLFISIDQEGGVVSRLSGDFTLFPGNFALGKTNDIRLCHKTALAMAHEMRYAGINLNFSPVVDINCDKTTPYTGFRSFGSDTKKVVQFASTMLKGFRKKGLLGTLKHFPGIGSVKTDSHIETPVISKSLEDLKKQDFIPFKQLKNEADFIMTSHVLCPSLDEENPVTISKKALDYLKKEIGYKGLIISDSLTMDGLLKQGLTIELAAVKAFNAGCDLLLIGGKMLNNGQNTHLSLQEVKKIHQALVNAVLDNTISEERLNEALGKISACKAKLTISEVTDFKIQEHEKISQKISRKAIFSQFNISKDQMFNHYFLMTSRSLNKKITDLDKDLNFLSDKIFFDQTHSDPNCIDKISCEDLIIFLTGGLKKHRDDHEMYQKLIAKNKKVFLIDLSENEVIDTKGIGIIRTNNPHESSLKLAFSMFKQEFQL